MAHADFVHLRVHSAYSLSEGAIKVKALADLCRRHAMPALAVTDSGNLFGALEISQAMMAAGVQPIIGCQITLARDDKETFGSPRPAPDQLVLLAQSEAGYGNLLKLVSQTFLAGEVGTPPQVATGDLAVMAKCLFRPAQVIGPDLPTGPLARSRHDLPAIAADPRAEARQ